MFLFQIHSTRRARNELQWAGANDISTQWELHKSHLSSLSTSSGKLTSSVSNISQTERGRKSDSQFWQSDLIPIELENGSTVPTAVNFSIKAYSASGAEVLNALWQNNFVSRDVAPQFRLSSEQDLQLAQSFSAGLELSLSICKNAAWPSLFDLEKINSVSYSLEEQIRSQYDGKPHAKDLFGFAKKQMLSLYSKEASSSALKSISAGINSLTDGFRVVGYASNDAVPDRSLYSIYGASGKRKSDEQIRSDRALAHQMILKKNISLAEENSKKTGAYLGVNASTSVYYNSSYWNSIYGIAILSEQMLLHAKTAKNAFLAGNQQDAHYPGKGSQIADDNFNSKLATLKQAAKIYGVDLGQSLTSVISELEKIAELTSRIFEKLGLSQEQMRSMDYSADSDRRFSRMLASDAEFASLVSDAQALLGEFTVKYAVARWFGTNREGGGANPTTKPLENWLDGVSDDVSWLSLSNVPGYIAMNYSMDYVGRGADFLPPSQLPILDMEYLVDYKNSIPVMGAEANSDANSGYARVLWVVRINKETSLVRENPDEFKKQLEKMANSANSGTDIYVHGVSVEDSSSHTDYVVEIRDPFSVRTEQEANSFSSKIYVPRSLYDSSAGTLLLYEMDSKLKSSTAPPPEESDRDPYFGLFARGGLTYNPDLSTTYPKALTTARKNAGSNDLDMGERPISAGTMLDLYYGIFGLERYTDEVTYWRLTYLQDAMPDQYDVMAWSLLGTFMADRFGSDYSGLTLTGFNSFMSDNMDVLVKEYMTENITEKINDYPVLKGTSTDFLNSVSKINEWSPIDSDLLSWTIRLGGLMKAREAFGSNAPKWLKDEITTAKSKTISSPVNYVLPDEGAANAFWAYSCDSLVHLSKAFRDQGLTLGMTFGDFGIVQLTASPSFLGMGAFAPSTKLPGFEATAKFENVNAFGINAVMKLFEKDKTSNSPLSAVRLIVDYYSIIPSNRQYYEYNEAVNSKLFEISKEFGKPLSERDSPPGKIYAAALAIKGLLRVYTGEGVDEARKLCDELLIHCNPSDSLNYDIHDGGQAWGPFTGLSGVIYRLPEFKGGIGSDATFSVMNYSTPKNTYTSNDPLTFASQITGMIRSEFEFEQKIPGFLDVSGVLTVYPIPPALATAVATATISDPEAKEVFEKAMADLPQFSKNWMVPINFDLTAKREFEVAANSALTAGANLRGSASAAKVNELKVFVNYVINDAFTRNLDASVGVSGAYARSGPVGTLNPTYGASANVTYAIPGMPGANMGARWDWGETIMPSGHKFKTSGLHLDVRIPLSGFKTYKGEPKDIPQLEYPYDDYKFRRIEDLTPALGAVPPAPKVEEAPETPKLIIKKADKSQEKTETESSGQGLEESKKKKIVPAEPTMLEEPTLFEEEEEESKK